MIPSFIHIKQWKLPGVWSLTFELNNSRFVRKLQSLRISTMTLHTLEFHSKCVVAMFAVKQSKALQRMTLPFTTRPRQVNESLACSSNSRVNF